MSDAPTKRRYPFLRNFEAGLCLAIATMPRAYERVGHALDPERMNAPGADLVVKAAQLITHDQGVPPASRDIVMQRIRSIVHEGKVKFERLQQAELLLDLADDLGSCDDMESLIDEAVPVVRDFAGQEAVDKTIGEISKGINAGDVAERFNNVAAIGIARETTHAGISFTAEEAADICIIPEGNMRPTGIAEVDRMLQGGLERGAIAVAVGQTGVGKSQFLIQVGADGILSGEDVAYITLELSPKVIKRRLFANLTNLTFEEMQEDSELVAERLYWLKTRLGRFEVVYFTPQVTTVQDVARWLRDRKRDASFDPKLLIFDMGDHFVSKVNSERPSYEDMRIVYDGMRQLAVDREGWAWTASHLKGGNVGKKRVSSDQVADSQHKSRKADLMITLTQTDEDKDIGQIRYALAKRRDQDDSGAPALVSTDLARGRIALLNRSTPWG